MFFPGKMSLTCDHMENRPSQEMLIETEKDKTDSREGQDGNFFGAAIRSN